MPALIDRRLCDSSPYCAASGACPKGAMRFDRKLNQVTIDIDLCAGCPGYCASACPMKAVKYAATMQDYERLQSEMSSGPSAEELFEQQYGVKPVDPRADGINLVHANASDFTSYVLDSPVPVAVDFWAAWCAPCKILAPTFKDVAAEYDGKMRFVKVDAEENPDLASKYGVMSIPTVAIFANGKMIDRSVGAVSKPQLKARLDKVLGSMDAAKV